jgi:DNA-directed RNA polymerase subunit RPC12/RpoP
MLNDFEFTCSNCGQKNSYKVGVFFPDTEEQTDNIEEINIRCSNCGQEKIMKIRPNIYPKFDDLA